VRGRPRSVGSVTLATSDVLPPSTDVRARYVPGTAVSPQLVAAWRDLAERAAEPNVLAEPEVFLPSVRHLAGRSRVGLLVVGTDDRLDALLPVVWPVTVRGVPVPVLQAWVEPYRVHSTPLLDADRAVPAMAALLRPPATLPAFALLLRHFQEGGPVAEALDTVVAERGEQAVRLGSYERALLLRDGGPAPSRNRRNRYSQLRRQRETMAEQLGEVRVVDRTGDPAAIEEFLQLEASGWKGAAGTALATIPGHADWFREVCDGLRTAGRLEVSALEAGGRTAAMWANFDTGEGSLHFKSAYDETLGDYRPGQLLVMEAIDSIDGGRYAWRDSATSPDNTLFNQLWPSRTTLSTVVVPLHGRVGRVAVHAARAAATMRDRLRQKRNERQPV
jgi:hypothetical protein